MADIRAPDKETIRKAYESGKYTFKKLSEEFEVSQGTIKSWAKRDKDNGNPWVKNKSKKVATKQKTKSKKVATKNEKKVDGITEEKVIDEVLIENDELTEKQRLFCLYYIKSFNQTMAAIKAGYSKDRAHVTGSELVRNSKVATEIRRLKGAMQEEAFIDAMDVLNKYIKIAFADITEYVTFGQKEVPVTGPFGPIEDKKGNPVTKIVNYVDFNESDVVDGSIIKEVKQGKDGVSIKFEDKMKALDKLSEYFDLFPDKFKRKIEEEKLELEKLKFNGDGKDNDREGIDDFIKATSMTEKEIEELFKGDDVDE